MSDRDLKTTAAPKSRGRMSTATGIRIVPCEAAKLAL